jgi:5'-deoxynucleotidase YfbR-like HD superfamily hydrolase
VLFGEERDWKELMSEESQVELADLIEKTKKHRSAYMQADDVKVAQLWAALTEVSKSVKMLECKLCKIEGMIKEFREIGETAKKDALRERIGDIFKPKTSKEREQVEKVVDSLMEF